MLLPCFYAKIAWLILISVKVATRRVLTERQRERDEARRPGVRTRKPRRTADEVRRLRRSVELIPRPAGDLPRDGTQEFLDEDEAIAFIHDNKFLFQPDTGNTQLMAYYAQIGPRAKQAVDSYAFPS